MFSWKSPSGTTIDPKTGLPVEYDSVLNDNGLLQCNCRGYYIKRKDKPKFCSHLEKFVKQQKLNTVQRGDHVYVVGEMEGQLFEQAETRPYADIHTEAVECGYVNPMLASALTKGEEARTIEDILAKTVPYQNDDHIAEEKWNGQRKVISKHNGKVYAWSRPRAGKGQIGLASPLPSHIERACQGLPDGTFDTEIIVPSGKHYDVTELDQKHTQVLMFFDIMRMGDVKCLDVPYAERRTVLEACMKVIGNDILRIGSIGPVDEQTIRGIWERDGEGVIIKRKNAIYRPGYRSPDWIKVKLIMPAVLTVTGFKKGKNGPCSTVLLRDDNGAETRVKTKNNDWLSAFEADPERYIGQRLVISHQGRTPDNGYMHPMWDHWAGEGE